jgi:hypothetical protein
MGRGSVNTEAGGAVGDTSLAGGVETGSLESVGGAVFVADSSPPFFSGSAESEVSVRSRGRSAGLHEAQ